MNPNVQRLILASVAMAALGLATAAPSSWARDAKVGKAAEATEVPMKDARLKIELNSTDGDAGIQVFVDADPWKWLEIYDPNDRLIFRSTAYGRFAKQGGTELFMESAEPDFSELPLADFLRRFPEGEYEFEAQGLDGQIFVGSANFTHNLPAGPELVSPLDGTGLVDPNHAVMTWKPVGPANGSPIVGYQVLVVLPQSSIPAIPKIVLDVMMPPTATSMAVPPGFLRPNTRYEWEVLAIEASGNQTLSTAFFQTKP